MAFVPDTLAKNCIVLGCVLEGTTNAYSGDTDTEIGPVCVAMKTLALPVCIGSAWLVAVIDTGFTLGAAAGAR